MIIYKRFSWETPTFLGATAESLYLAVNFPYKNSLRRQQHKDYSKHKASKMACLEVLT
jgi:hypothetical protein